MVRVLFRCDAKFKFEGSGTNQTLQLLQPPGATDPPLCLSILADHSIGLLECTPLDHGQVLDLHLDERCYLPLCDQKLQYKYFQLGWSTSNGVCFSSAQPNATERICIAYPLLSHHILSDCLTQVWGWDPFSPSLMNEATHQCLTVQASTLVVADCEEATLAEDHGLAIQTQTQTLNQSQSQSQTQSWSLNANGTLEASELAQCVEALPPSAASGTEAAIPCFQNATVSFPGDRTPVAGSVLGVLPESFGGDITISAWFRT